MHFINQILYNIDKLYICSTELVSKKKDTYNIIAI